jgi:hypothetical protein
MSWKNILKAQRSLIDFGLEPKSTNLAGMQRDEQMNKEIAEMEKTIKDKIVGRNIKFQRVDEKTGRNTTQDLSKYLLDRLNQVKSTPFPENIEALKQFKEEFSKHV